MKRRFSVIFVLALAGSILCSPLLAQTGTSQSTQGTASAAGNEKPGTYVGVASCAGSGCHGSPNPVENSNIRMDEYDLWFNAPAPTHVKAFEVLYNDVSKRIAKNMRLKTSADKAKICLDCHATNVPESLRAGTIEVTDGVQCESCHGPAGGWRATHVQPNSHEDSVAKGMWDLRNLETRTKVCTSCHLGDETKTVDHELIGAGHPILTFELDNFTESKLMPPHWKRIDQKVNKEGLRESHGVRAWAVGQAVTFQEGLNYIVRSAKSEEWPEFAVMSCANCHHGLRGSEWRQERGFKDVARAGQPPWSPQRWAALRYIVSSISPDDRAALDADVAKLNVLISRMSPREEVITVANSINSRMKRITPKIEDARWDERRIRNIMAAIAADSQWFGDNDRQTAEQATYALVTLSSYLVRANPRLVRSDMMKTVDSLYKQLGDLKYPDEFDHRKFASTMQQLGKQVR